MEQEIPIAKWPHDINMDYIKAVNPNGLIRTWFYAKYTNIGANFTAGLTAVFTNVAKGDYRLTLIIEEEKEYKKEDFDTYFKDFREHTLLVKDLKNEDIDTIR